MKRRNLLVGLGTAGAGALVGSGAFRSITADRSAAVEVVGDASGLLSLSPYEGEDGEAEYASMQDGRLAISLDGYAEDVEGEGLLQDSVTDLGGVFSATNQGSEPVVFWVAAQDDGFDFYADGNSIEGESQAVSLGVGESVVVGLEVDTTDADVGTMRGTVTLRADADESAGGGEEPSDPSASRIYVDPASGDDESGDGSSSSPYATIEAARDHVRGLDLSNVSGDVVVDLAAGTYDRSDGPLELGPQDSGTQETAIVYSGPAEGEAALDGGRRLDLDWSTTTVNGVDAWRATIDDVANGDFSFRQLFVDGERRRRPILSEQTADQFRDGGTPASPDDWGLYPITESSDPMTFTTDAIDASWHNFEDVEVVMIHSWMDGHSRIESYDESTGQVTLARRSYTVNQSDASAAEGFYLANVKEALTKPGQWYLDQSSGELFYVPMEGESPDDTEFVAPESEDLLLVEGEDGADGARVENLRFENLSFQHTSWQYQPQYAADSQAENVPEAVQLRGVENSVFRNCTFRHIGQWALNVHYACDGVRVVRNEFRDLGAGGLKVGQMRTREFGTDMPATPEWKRSTGHQVSDNEFAWFGQVFHRATGVNALHTSEIVVTHNHLHDAYYGGIFGGGSPKYDEGIDYDNVYAYNYVHDVMKRLLSDGAGIYMRGVLPGVTVRNNRVHTVYHQAYGGNGLYGDLGATAVSWRNNVVFDCDAGFHVHFGSDMEIANNVLADADQALFAYSAYGKDGRPSEAAPIEVTNNVLAADGTNLFAGGYGRDATGPGLVSDRNLLWNYAGDLTFNEAGGTGLWDTAEGLHADQEGMIYGPVNFKYDSDGSSTSFVTATDLSSASGRVGSESGANEIGFQFTTGSSPVAVTHLGRYVHEGNAETHELYIARASDGTVVSGGTASVDLSSASAGGYAYAELSSPVTLEADTTYYVVSSEQGADEFYSPVGVTTTDVATVEWPAWTFGGTLEPLGIEDWRSAGFDENSVVADPEFVDRPNDEYSLQDSSPALDAPVNFDPITGEVGIRDQTPVARPTGLSASLNADGTVALSWGSVSGATGYMVYRTDGNGWTQVANPSEAAYTDDPGTGTFEYAVSALEADTESLRSPTVSVDTNPAPSNVSASRSGSSVTISWDAVPVADSYNVYRATDKGGPYSKLNSSAVTATEYTDDSALDDVAYYVVRTVSGGAESENSTPVRVSPPLTPVSGSDLQTFTADGVTATFSGVDDGAPFTIECDGMVENEFHSQQDDYGVVYAADALGEAGSVVVKIDSLERTHWLTQAGIMVKNDVTKPGESLGYATMLVKTQGSGVEDYVMATDDDDTGYVSWSNADKRGGGFYEFPSWLKLEKDGTTFTGYAKKNEGDDWTEIYSTELSSANATQDIGVFATSGRTDELATAEFGEFLIT